MAYNYRSVLTNIGRAFDGVATTISVAREVDMLYKTPESTFRARGTTRAAAVRAATDRL
ncbi:hypothetical protein OEG84_22670 [Hoeflea sp. G2-23]|uniref:Uncharacterized protein n=1 Tax=Hoeflea algicola TaxID=2983763 RepID=A0ABT3ZF47_9HYPH|nr:hypothetical protein [Hoeflea algicola]MCY0150430.1 hypothetical protein [Hoeflea algicola]